MLSAVQYIHHRNGKAFRMTAAQILIQRKPECFSTGPGYCQGNAQNRVCPQIFLILRAVSLCQQPVHIALVQGIFPQHSLRQLLVDVIHSLLYTHSVVFFLSVPQLHSLKFSRGCS